MVVIKSRYRIPKETPRETPEDGFFQIKIIKIVGLFFKRKNIKTIYYNGSYRLSELPSNPNEARTISIVEGYCLLVNFRTFLKDRSRKYYILSFLSRDEAMEEWRLSRETAGMGPL